MKKFSVMLAAAVMAVSVCACGKETVGQDGGMVMEPTQNSDQNAEPAAEIDENTEDPADTTADMALATPVVKDGETRPGEDAVEVYFEWNPVEGADGYEVTEQSKFCNDENFGEPSEPVETTETSYVTSAQDTFDFLIKVRAFKGNGDSRVYSEWSNEAVGFSYDDADVSLDSEKVTFNSYDEIIAKVSEGLKNGFSEDDQFSLDISSCFFMNDPEFEILGYMKKDLDGDGTEELILGENAADGSDPGDGWDSIIYDIFAMKDGKVVHVLDGWERNRYNLCTDGSIANTASGGAAYSSWAFYTIEDCKIKIIESVFTDEDENMEGHWYYSTKEPYEDESNEISEDEGMKTIEKYTYQKLEFTPFN